MTRKPTILAVLLALSLTTPALAQTQNSADEAVSTAARKPDLQDAEAARALATARAAATPATRALTTEEQIAAWLAASPPVRLAEDAPGVTQRGDDAPRRIHGSAGVTIGTGGYRSAYVSTLIPIGETSTLGLAVSQTDFGNRIVFHPRDDFGYGEAGGFGPSGWSGDTLGYGRAGRWGRGGKQQSVAVSLAIGAAGGPPPEGCAPAFRDGGRYVEPLWATEMRGDQNPCSPEGRR
jgi:hypothetical protein